MGEIVAALGTCHTPYLFTRPPDENAQQLDAAAAAIQELGKALDEARTRAARQHAAAIPRLCMDGIAETIHQSSHDRRG